LLSPVVEVVYGLAIAAGRFLARRFTDFFLLPSLGEFYNIFFPLRSEQRQASYRHVVVRVVVFFCFKFFKAITFARSRCDLIDYK
jgi:hypothetical protein